MDPGGIRYRLSPLLFPILNLAIVNVTNSRNVEVETGLAVPWLRRCSGERNGKAR